MGRPRVTVSVWIVLSDGRKVPFDPALLDPYSCGDDTPAGDPVAEGGANQSAGEKFPPAGQDD